MTAATNKNHPLHLIPLLSLASMLALGCGTKQTEVEAGDDEDPDGTSDGDGDSADEVGTSDGDGDGDSTTTSGDGDGDGDTAEGFVPMSDGAFMNTCDPANQDCPEGEKCTGYVVEEGYCCVDANKCVPVIGDKQVGDPCVRTEDNDDCAAGLFCMTMTSGSTGDGVCLAFCDAGTQDCAEDGLPDAQCIAFNDGVLPLCQNNCDPLLQDCGGESGCYGVGVQGFVCSIPGYEEGLGNDGDMCYTVQSCKPGLECTATEVLDGCNSATCCTPFCDLTAPETCTAPESCVSYFEEGTAPPGYEDVGLCVIPA